MAAKFAGISQPFGLPSVTFVFDLRVAVAIVAFGLLAIAHFGPDDLLTISSFIAEPNQYLKYSGAIWRIC